LSFQLYLDLNERLKELENSKFTLEQARQEKKVIQEEVEALKREVQSLKKVKDKLFLEIQRMKVPPPKKGVYTEKEIQTEPVPGIDLQSDKKMQHLGY
jgi:hypothetical protein